MLIARMDTMAKERISNQPWDAVGLVMHNLPSLFAYADVAEKAATVTITEIRGICPQHFAMLAIFGDTASVETAIKKIHNNDNIEQKAI
jgi:microcompartment protein CcmL/EutN